MLNITTAKLYGNTFIWYVIFVDLYAPTAFDALELMSSPTQSSSATIF